MKIRKYFNGVAAALIIGCFGVGSVSASEFMDNRTPEKLLSFGVRLGITSSTQSVNFKKLFPDTKVGNTDWGTGFETGIVANLNIRNYFALQPGFFFQNRSYDYTIINANFKNGELINRFGHTRSYSFQIPVLASFRFAIAKNVKWHLDFGPYFAFGLGGGNNMETYRTIVSGNGSAIGNNEVKEDFYGDGNGVIIGMKTFDWGVKMGTALTFYDHYYFGIHYAPSLKNIAKDNASFLTSPTARNKAWTFTIGYDF